MPSSEITIAPECFRPVSSLWPVRDDGLPSTRPGAPAVLVRSGAMSALTWTGDDSFTVGDLSFRARDLFTPFARPVGDDEFFVFKPIPVTEFYAELFAGLQPRNVVELGVYDGGSTVLFSALSDIDKLVAVDIADGSHARFEAWLEGQRGRVHVHFGVDQADDATLRGIVDREFGDTPLDLVVDDASHLLGPTRASFDVLFPRLRPGGLYVIEDWTIRHEMERLFSDPEQRAVWEAGAESQSEHVRQIMSQPPLSLLLFEAQLALAFNTVVADVTIRREWAIIKRGEGPVDPATFRIADCSGPEARSFLNGN